MVKDGEKRKVERRFSLKCADEEGFRRQFEPLVPFQVVVEATSSYEWFLLRIEDLANRWVLAHPKKLRVIAESKNKSDKIDAHVLAEFLLLDMIPEAYRPTPRIRQHRVLVRHRHAVQRQITAVKCKLRHKAAFYNADTPQLFTTRGLKHLAGIAMSSEPVNFLSLRSDAAVAALMDSLNTIFRPSGPSRCSRQIAQFGRSMSG